MGASNLPPGVTESMIPGNRPEDEAWDKFADVFMEKTEGMEPEDWYFIMEMGLLIHKATELRVAFKSGQAAAMLIKQFKDMSEK